MSRILLTGARVRGFASGSRVAGRMVLEDLSSFAESEELHAIATLPSGENNLVVRGDASRAGRRRRWLGIHDLASLRPRIWEMP